MTTQIIDAEDIADETLDPFYILCQRVEELASEMKISEADAEFLILHPY
jgi:hypothetical protein